jgi:hypothetical protein
MYIIILLDLIIPYSNSQLRGVHYVFLAPRLQWWFHKFVHDTSVSQHSWTYISTPLKYNAYSYYIVTLHGISTLSCDKLNAVLSCVMRNKWLNSILLFKHSVVYIYEL